MDFIKKYAGLIVAGIVFIVLLIAVFTYTSNVGNELTNKEVEDITAKYNKEYDPEIAADLAAQEKMLSVAVPLTIGIALLLAGATLTLSVLKLIQTPDKLIKFLIPFAVMCLFILITYFTASDDMDQINTKVPYTETELKIAGAIMNSTFILIILGIVSFVGLRIYKVIKR